MQIRQHSLINAECILQLLLRILLTNTIAITKLYIVAHLEQVCPQEVEVIRITIPMLILKLREILEGPLE